MAGWTTFKLGRPVYEYTFTANPDEFNPEPARLSSDQRNLSGALKERVLCTFLPTVKIKSGWFPKATDYDNIVSLLSVTDTMLSFITRDDWKMILEYNVAASTTTVLIQNTSISRLSAALVAAGGASSITVTGVFDNPAGTGTNYYTGGGSYADATRTVTLHTALSSVIPVYVSYTFTGWLVRLKRLSAPIQGGRVDLFNYDFALEGA